MRNGEVATSDEGQHDANGSGPVAAVQPAAAPQRPQQQQQQTKKKPQLPPRKPLYQSGDNARFAYLG